MKTHIVNYIIQEERTRVLSMDKYERSSIPDRKRFKRWLRSKIIVALIRFGFIENAFDDQVTYKRVKIEEESVLEIIKKLYGEMYRYRGVEPQMVILGYAQMKRLKIEAPQYISFHMPVRINGSSGIKVFGLDVKLTPNIDGVILV